MSNIIRKSFVGGKMMKKVMYNDEQHDMVK